MELIVDYKLGSGLQVTTLDGQDPFAFSLKVKAYNMAISELEGIVIELAEEFRSIDQGRFLWCQTGEFLRPENNTDLLRLFYFRNLIVSEDIGCRRILIRTSLPKWWLDDVKSRGIIVSLVNARVWESKITNKLKSIYWFFRVARKNVIACLQEPTPSISKVLIDINEGPQDNRLDEFENYKNSECGFYSGQEHTIQNIQKERIVVFRSFLKFGDLFKAIIELYRIKKFIKRNQRVIALPWLVYLTRYKSWIKLYDLILYEKSIQRFFANQSITDIIHVSTITKPTYRTLWREASRNKVKVTLIASRTLKNTSCSDRLLKPDLLGYHGCSLPYRYIVKDEISYQTLKQAGILNYARIFQGSNFRSKSEKVEKLQIDVKNKGVIIYAVFTHLIGPSTELLKGIRSFVNSYNAEISAIFIRFHPSNRMNIKQVGELFNEHEVVDHTGQNLTDLISIQNTIIGITGPSTGGFELSEYVDVNIWFPFVWSDGILFNDVSSDKDIICTDMKDIPFLPKRISEILEGFPERKIAKDTKSYFQILKELKVL